ncbi:MAG: c-type cytochrome, partial [Phycisphaeraceae bacterium]
RLWVIEYPAYNWEYREKLGLPSQPPPGGRVVVLDDTTGDGQMDHRTVFLDDLDNARALALVADGVLVGQPPDLWFYRDTTGDGHADQREKLFDDYGPLTTVHAQPSGLLRAMDNWIYSTRYTARLRWRDGQWIRDEPIVARGQWGISQDNHGRLFYNTQTDPLRGDVLPPVYWRRNPNWQNPVGINVRFAHDLRDIQPHEATPGVNQRWDGFLDPQGRLAHFTSSGSPMIYRGDHFSPDLVGDAFVCVPAGNLIRHYQLAPNEDGSVTAANAYEGHEFLFSHDERVRPVQVSTGPDGALYVVDMHRGIIEGHTWITDITRDYIIKRQLHEPFNGLGRIYRIVQDDRPREEPRDLADLAPSDWVNALAHPNGWRRDTAQRLLVEHDADDRVIQAIRELSANQEAQPHVRLHALWTLEGLNALARDDVMQGLADPAPEVRAAALRLAERWLDEPVILSTVVALRDDAHLQVRRQLLLTLGETRDAKAEAAMRRLLLNHGSDHLMAEAAITGLHGREMNFLAAIIDDPASVPPPPGLEHLVALLATAVTNEGAPTRLGNLAARVGRAEGWWRSPILAGIAEGRTANLTESDEALRTLLNLPDDQLRERATVLIATIETEPIATRVDPEKLEESVRLLYDRGRTGYLICAACHQTDGGGFEGVAPPLVGSPWLERDAGGMIRIVLHGYSDRDAFPPMSPLIGLDDDQIAAILTYLRLTLAENATPVQPEQVRHVREQPRNQLLPWDRETLEALIE